MRQWLLILFLLGCAFASDLAAAEVGLIKINGVIGPATAGYIARAVQLAGTRKQTCLVIEIDTPGGLLESTEQIVQTIYSAPVPVVVYVTPSGAYAASAGCFITLAADIAAMAPHTTIGAAHPVTVGGGSSSNDEGTNSVMKQKLENHASRYIESIADKRGRNVDWARSSVLKSETATAEQALELKVIDLVASDLPELVQKLDGRAVRGSVLKTAGAGVFNIEMSARERIFQSFARPEVMLLLMMMATFGIIAELNTPGAILPGVVGAIALILALYLGAILPINIAGLALLGLSMLLFIADIFAPTHGILTFGGIGSFFLGALMLFNRADPAFRLSLNYIIPATLLMAAFFFFVILAGLRAQRLPVRTGQEAMIGLTAEALSPIDAQSGKIFVEGEYWNAVSDTPIEPGRPIQVVGIEGLTLRVKARQT